MSKQPLQVIKIGGKVIEDDALLAPILNAFTALEGHKLLVHGGGKRASEVSRALGIEPRMHQGRRITGAGDLEVATMVYAGLANKHIVGLLQARGCNALGLSGADAGVIRARKRPVGEVDFGFVGDIIAINDRMIEQFIEAGLTPVFCAITHDGQGQLLNTNADAIAAHVAMAMAPHYAVTLRYCFEKPGVLLDPNDDNSVIRRLSFADYQQHQRTGVVSAGMLPKLENGFAALRAGVQEVVISGATTLGKNQGTEIVI